MQDVLWEAKLKWYNIGLRLKMKSHELDAINKEAGDDTGEKLTLMIKSRLNMAEHCTWKDLYEALKHHTVCMQDVADKLKKLKQKGKHYVFVHNVVHVCIIIHTENAIDRKECSACSARDL